MFRATFHYLANLFFRNGLGTDTPALTQNHLLERSNSNWALYEDWTKGQ
jgi:hypothetical protein